jgi:peptide/nickel transport system permease protein
MTQFADVEAARLPERTAFGRGAWRRRPTVLVLIAFAVLTVIVVIALFGRLIAPQNPSLQNLADASASPSGAHWLGTDNLGRDILSRVLAGGGQALIGPLAIALGAMVISVVAGIWAGYTGGWFESAVMRLVDLGYALPPLLVALVIAGVVGGGYWIGVAVLLVLFSPYDVRIIRSVALEQRGLPYVEAARTLGLSRAWIMTRHILPNVVPFVIVDFCLDFAFALVTISGLSYLGLGAPPGSPDWGRMLADNQSQIFGDPLGALAPGLLILLTAAAVNIIGDWGAERIAASGGMP